MTKDSEQMALMEFITARPYGNLLREIAERRLCDIQNIEIKSVDPSLYPPVIVGYFNELTGQKYSNLKRAVEITGMPYMKIHHDIYYKRFKLNIKPVYSTTNY